YENAGSYTTVIYRRDGTYLTETQVIVGDMGYLLDFTADGKMLIDASVKRALVNNGGTFEDEMGFLDELPANVKSQAISDHAQQIATSGRFYNGALPAFVTDAVNTASLKLV